MAVVENDIQIAALYSAIFRRAPDKQGLDFWLSEMAGGASLSKASDGFTQHPAFTEIYGGLSDRQFVEALYVNVLGAAGDAGGIDYWVAQLASGNSKGRIVAEFVKGALEIELDTLLANGQLTAAEYEAAVIRQDTLTNKGYVGVQFAEMLGEASNLRPETDAKTVAGLESDPAYLASQAAIATVTADPNTANAALTQIDLAASSDNPVGYLLGEDRIQTLTPDGDYINLWATMESRDIIVIPDASSSRVLDNSGDGKVTINPDTAPDGSIDMIDDFVVGGLASSDRIDVSAFGFTGAQQGVVDLTNSVDQFTDLTRVDGFFSTASGDKAIAYVSEHIQAEESDGTYGSLWVFIDANKDGDFAAAEDVLIDLGGIPAVSTTDFIF